ncbi:hypothetical protein ZEAMMB73_Zm00001d037162 [Zea mays]|uniref:Uncharacterized protein n=1 Tax=Zea mays TaxID=4577 RepID=A0A1D6LV95_MAIZE|nr:hypothetical protein ZEAMMB73_Zm00001d037162 [Zea mays]
MWKDNIVDVKYKENGQDLYLGLANSEIATRKNMGRVAKISVPVMASVLALMATGMYLVWICKLRELPFVIFGNNATATDNFSSENMLGQGGFGKVYKNRENYGIACSVQQWRNKTTQGMLGHNIEVAIKRLGQGSGQGA